MIKKTSIYDIAKELNIAASTVSRALNGQDNISEAVRKKVLLVAQELNYQPNKMAKNLKMGCTNTIGVIIPQLNRYFFSNAIDGIEMMASNSGYNVIIYQTQNDVNQEIKAIKNLNRSVVDGLLISVVADQSDYSHFKEAQELGMPLIFFDRYPMSNDFKRVCMDDAEASRKAVAHLASTGRKKIFHFSGNQCVSIWKERTNGYMSMMKDLGIIVEPEWIFQNTQNLDSGIEAAERMIKEGNIPEAIYASSDHPMLGAMSTFKRYGYKIPNDISMMGFGDEIFSPFTDPSLSTVDQHPREMGKEAFIQLERMIQNKEVPDEVIIKHDLIIRGSSML